jgi:hypothetical protein
MDYHGGGASDVAEEVGYDETGIRPRGRDLHSGPEKGNFHFSTFSLIPNLPFCCPWLRLELEKK